MVPPSRRALFPVFLALLAACGGGSATSSGVEQGLPPLEVLRLDFPGPARSGSSLTSALVGARSGLYSDAESVARLVDDALAAVIEVLATTRTDATRRDMSPDRSVWRVDASKGGPWLLAVERMPDGHFEFEAARSDEDGWRVVLAGSTTLVGEGDRGQGAVWVDLGAFPNGTGKVLALWSREPGHRSLTVDLFHASREKATVARRDGTFHYQADDAGAGTFVFQAGESDQAGTGPGEPAEAGEDAGDGKADAPGSKADAPGQNAGNMTPGAAEPPADDVAIPKAGDVILRWTAAGAGRADLVGKALPAKGGYDRATWSECWVGPSFLVTWEGLSVSGDQRPAVTLRTAGDPATCPYAEAGVPALPPAGSEPPVPAVPPEAADED